MNSKQIIDGIKRVCRQNYVNPKDVKINYRHDYDSDIWCIRDVQLVVTGPTDEVTAQATRRIDGKGGINGQQFIDRLEQRCRNHKLQPQKVRAEFRIGRITNRGGGCSYPIRAVEEDLFDAESNSVLETLMLVTDTSDK